MSPQRTVPPCTQVLARLSGSALLIKSEPVTFRLTEGSAKPVPNNVSSPSWAILLTAGTLSPAPTTAFSLGARVPAVTVTLMAYGTAAHVATLHEMVSEPV